MLKMRREEIMKLKNPNVKYLSEVEDPNYSKKRNITPQKKNSTIVEKPTIVRYSDNKNINDGRSSVLDSRLSSKFLTNLNILT